MPASASSLAALQSFLERFWVTHGLPDAERFAFDLALEEIFINVVTHGSEGLHDVRFELVLATDAGRVFMELRDGGNPFDPFDAPPPDLDLDIEDRPVGGLGIFLLRTMMDDVRYAREDEKNVLTLVKQTGTASGHPPA